MILTVIRRNLHSGLVGRIEETVEVGGRIVVAFRPDQPRNDDRPLDQGIAYVVVTMRDGLVVELKAAPIGLPPRPTRRPELRRTKASMAGRAVLVGAWGLRWRFSVPWKALSQGVG